MTQTAQPLALEALALLHADPLCHPATRLLQLMCLEARRRYPEEWPAGAPRPRNEPLAARSVFLIARLDRRLVGCAAMQPIDGDVAELRRMYVIRHCRRHGVATALLHEIEALARGRRFQAIRFATGIRQPEAIEFYEGEGYARITPYGAHMRDPLSLCYEKALS